MFLYDEAFSRNLGWVTAAEQRVLRTKCIAIAGLGGVGGVHLLTLARLGVGAFHLADFDVFELPNFNRQAGAMVSTIGRRKLDVMAEMARDINPDLRITSFPQGVTSENVSDFLTGVDLYVDGLDFFAFPAREATFDACGRLGIPAVTAAPLGMGAAVLTFLPGHMTFEQYFRLRGHTDEQKALRFMLGLAPAGVHLPSLVDRSRLSLAERRGPSTAMGCQLCAGVAATEALKILLRRGKVTAAPHGYHFDAYRQKFVRTWRPGGNANPLQRVRLAIAAGRLSKSFTHGPADGSDSKLK
jgi:molybdopterin/thiamine biosynthesis adenylyltransferase